MERDFDIQGYMTKGVERIVSDALRATVKNPKESAYMLKFAAASKKHQRREQRLKLTENIYLRSL